MYNLKDCFRLKDAKGQLYAREWHPRPVYDINSETSMYSIELNWINVIFLTLRWNYIYLGEFSYF